MSDATNDTTRTDAAVCPHCKGDKIVLGVKACVCSPLPRVQCAQCQAYEAELLRLAGPPCDYPPCKGVRAIEHRIHRGRDGAQWLSTKVTANHPPSPAIEAWLRERGK